MWSDLQHKLNQLNTWTTKLIILGVYCSSANKCKHFIHEDNQEHNRRQNKVFLLSLHYSTVILIVYFLWFYITKNLITRTIEQKRFPLPTGSSACAGSPVPLWQPPQSTREHYPLPTLTGALSSAACTKWSLFKYRWCHTFSLKSCSRSHLIPQCSHAN